MILYTDQLFFAAPSTLTPASAQALIDMVDTAVASFSKKHNRTVEPENITVTYLPAPKHQFLFEYPVEA